MRRHAPQWVKTAIRIYLEENKSGTRDNLTLAVHKASDARGGDITWDHAARLVRLAVNDLLDEDVPVVSTGKHFIIATTPEQRRRARAHMRAVGIGALVHAARIAKVPLKDEMRQALLEYEEVEVREA